MARMDDDELRRLVTAEVQDAIGYMGNATEISAARAAAMRAYLGELYGDEKEGWSQVVSHDVADTVEWILPSLLRIFTAGDVVRFEPTGPEDQAFADQARDYLNHVFQKDNKGFMILYTWFKDALVQKNGIVKAWWDKKRTTRIDTFVHLDEATYILLVSPPDVTVLAHTAHPDGTHDVRIKRVVEEGYPCVQAVPPEEFLISRRAVSIETAPFVGHRSVKTRAELIAAGFDAAVVGELSTVTDRDSSDEAVVRWGREDTTSRPSGDPSMDEIEVIEAYLTVDYDGDGLAEIVKVTLAGGAEGKVLHTELAEEKPFAALCPLPLPHRFFGQSVADIVMDIQRIKTVLWRGYMNGVYMASNPQREVEVSALEKGGLDDLLHHRIGGIIRVKRMGAIREVQTPDIGPTALPALQYTDSVKQERTGVMPMSTGLDPNVLNNQSATAANLLAAAAAQRVELIARIFAETGVKDLFRLLLKLTVRHQDRARIVRLRNQWVPMEPGRWPADMDVTVEVGLGHGNRDRAIGTLLQMLGVQRDALGAGLPIVTPKNIYNAAAKLAAWSGLGAPDLYFTDPDSVPPAPPPAPPPNPAVLALEAQVEQARAKMALEVEKARAKAALEREEMERKHALEIERMNREYALKQETLAREAALERAAIDAKAAAGNGNLPEARL